MKKLIGSIMLVFIISSSFSQFSKAELQVNGLTCSMCSLATQKQLQTIEFIDSIGTDLNKTSYNLYFKDNSDVNNDLIKRKVEDAGFSVGSLVLTASFNNLTIGKNFHIDYKNATYFLVGDAPKIINGEVKLKIADKGFVTDKEFKTYKKYASEYPSILTGKTAEGKKAYHMILL